jgi:hypothetical protein
MPNIEVTFTGTWTPIPYTITYTTNSHGTLSSCTPTTYTIESTTITPSCTTTPSTGYKFKAFTPTSIPQGSTENKTITATWEKLATPTPTPTPKPKPSVTPTPTPTKPIIKLPAKVTNTIAKHHFTDISSLSKGRQTAIEWMYQYNITLGSPANSNTYKPKDTVNRGSMAEFLYKLRGTKKTTKSVPKLTDISKLGKGRQTAIKWLASEKITVPTKNKYNPNKAVNRGAMAEFLYKVAGSPTFNPTNADYSKIKDLSKVGNNAGRRKAIAWLVANNISVLDKGRFNPQNTVNRGSMAELLMKTYRVFVK